MRLPKELQKEEKEKVKDENFDKFIENLKGAISFNQEKFNTLQRYSSKINSLQENFDKALDYLKQTLESALSSIKMHLDLRLKTIEEENNEKEEKVKTSFTINSIKELGGVEDCYIEDDKLCVVLKEVKKDSYINEVGEINLKYTMPSYTIKYYLTDRESFRYRQSLSSEYKIRMKRQALSYSVELTDPEKHKALILKEKVLLNNSQNIFEHHHVQSPYQSFSSPLNSLDEYEPSFDICFGDHNSYQQTNLESFELIPHLLGVIQAMYTEDDEGRGHSHWARIINQTKKFELTNKFKEEFGNVDNFAFYIRLSKSCKYFNIGIEIESYDIKLSGDSYIKSIVFRNCYDCKDELKTELFYWYNNYLEKGDDSNSLPENTITINDKEYEVDEFIKKLKKIYADIITNGN